jgi:hypothetical protein
LIVRFFIPPHQRKTVGYVSTALKLYYLSDKKKTPPLQLGGVKKNMEKNTIHITLYAIHITYRTKNHHPDAGWWKKHKVLHHE